jgi:serralysin
MRSTNLSKRSASTTAVAEEWSVPHARNAAGEMPYDFNTVANGLFADTNPFRVNTITPGSQDQLRIAPLASGGFVVVWMTDNSVKAQLFDRQGEKLGAELLAGSASNDQPTVTGLASGGFVIAWSDFDDSALGVSARLFDAAGNPLTGAFRVNTETFGSEQQPTIAALSSGGFVVGWTDQDEGGGSDITAQIFDAAGAKVGGELAVNSTTFLDQYHPVVAGLPGGGFIVTWQDQLNGMRVQIFDAAGAKVGSEFQGAEGTGTVSSETIPILASGNFVIAWSDGDVKGQIYGPTGTKIGGEFLINTTIANDQYMVTLAPLPDGGFIATWRDATGTTNYVDDGEIRAQLFDALGAKVGGEFMVNVGTSGGQSLPQVTGFGPGDFIIAWVDYDSGLSDIKARSYFSVTMGTNGDDSFAGTGDRDFYQGLDGNDQIAGAAGDDGLNGGAGNDTLNGGAGNDELTGGTGADAMSGGGGNDIYEVDDAGDSVTELADEGVDEVRTGGALGQTLIGNGGANVLTGGGGSDYLVGLGGDDVLVGNSDAASTLQGGTGDDWYYVSRTGDSVLEASGEGNDRILASVSYTLSAGREVETLALADAAAATELDLTGNALAQLITGNAGANVLTGGGGADYLVGFNGDDILVGNADAASTLQGGNGDDWYYISRTGDSLVEFAFEGDDRILTSVSYTLSAGQEIETLYALDAASTNAIDLTGNALAQVINGNAGANVLTGGGGADYLVGFGGDDILVGNADAASTLQGGLGNDWYYISLTGDSLVEFANEGNDRILTSVSYTLSAGQEIETLAAVDAGGTAAINLTGNGFGQVIQGTNGVNTLSGDGGADDLSGFGGADTLLGGDGDDLLNGGAGNDVLNGGAGADLLVFADALGAGNVDTVQGFVSGQDRLLVENAVFTGLATGTLSAGAFATGTAAQDADDRFIYNSTTGELLFDADGNGAGAAIQFASFAPATILIAGDIVVI